MVRNFCKLKESKKKKDETKKKKDDKKIIRDTMLDRFQTGYDARAARRKVSTRVTAPIHRVWWNGKKNRSVIRNRKRQIKFWGSSI